MDLQDAVRLIQNKSGTDYDTVLANIEEKYKELAGLVTKEGAAYLVARQLGIEISNNKTGINDIKPTSRNISIIGRIVKISQVTEFKRQDGSRGTVANIFVADSTGQVRVSLWNDQTKLIEQLKTGDVVQVVNGMVRQSNFGV